VLVEGGRAPVVGRVSSDALAVDVTDLAAVDAESEFTLLGRAGRDVISAGDVAAVRGTISWEVLQQLGARLSRVYVSGGEPVAFRPESTIAVSIAEGASIPSY
jgi:alanine racemase